MLIVHVFVFYAHVNLCHFFSSPWCWLRLLLVALPGLFCLPISLVLHFTQYLEKMAMFSHEIDTLWPITHISLLN